MDELPSLPYAEWRDTRDTLHRWLQIVGKVQLALTPRVNHWWNTALSVTARGVTTSSMTYADRRFQMELDFVEHVLRIQPHDGHERTVVLAPRTVADFYAATMAALREIGVDCRIWTMPVELHEPAVPFELDRAHASYDREYVDRFWRALSFIDAVLAKFRARFIGKSSPVQFFWGSMDITLSRFSGRRAPPFEASELEREAYSHEVQSVGWWPGDPRFERPAFYSYAAPEPAGFARASVAPAAAYYDQALKGFYLDHDTVRADPDPEGCLLDFFETTYEAAAVLGAWPRAELERAPRPEEHHGNVYSPAHHG